jgi:hypothetical protein
MTNPITPPTGLVQLWVDLLPQGSITAFTAAAQWGADRELDACCEWLQLRVNEGWNPCHLEDLRTTRRPKPPSLKEQALTALKDMDLSLDDGHNASIIRQALEQLDD